MSEIKSVLALNKTYPEGMKTYAFALEYDKVLAPESVSAEQFAVIDHSYEPTVSAQIRSIVKVYTNDEKAACQEAKPGRYVIIETSLDERAAFAIGTFKTGNVFSPYGPEPIGFPDPNKPKIPPQGPKGPGGPPKGPKPDMGYCGPKPLKVEVKQLTDLTAADGSSIPAAQVICTEGYNALYEKFELLTYEDLPYNLLIPENYDPSKKYPLLLFIPDAGNRGENPRVPLMQGIGAAYFASDRDQKKHPCFIVAPCFDSKVILTHDDFTFDRKMYKAKAILDQVIATYSIDTDRIYTTGQSMGCMSSCQLMNEWPDFFAGAMLVAGQWSPERCGATMNHQNLWILVSENDRKAHPGMDAVTDAILANGGSVAKSMWNAALPVEIQNEKAKEALQEEANVHYTLFEGSSVVPADFEDAGPGANHVQTWRVAYQIDTVRDWLFTCHK